MKRVAIIYDFDGTLSPGNMQEYDFLPAVGKNNKKFWRASTQKAIDNDADPILCYLSEIILSAKSSGISLRRESFQKSGEKVRFFDGVEEWFSRINAYGKSRGVEVEHYINSSGIKEMIEGTKIAKEFKQIFACSFLYDVDGVAYWPGVSVNYTNKTQFIFKINKGIMEVWDTHKINDYMREENRPVPFENMIYIGDGTTDIPCMRLVREKLGHSIAVYDPTQKIPKAVLKLKEDGRVNFVLEADYRAGGRMDRAVSTIIDKLSAQFALEEF